MDSALCILLVPFIILQTYFLSFPTWISHIDSTPCV